MTTTRDLFPTTECSRCGGSGHYSFNLMYGTVCFKCNGTGKQFASKKVAEAAAAYENALNARKHVMVKNLEIGDKVVSDLSSRFDRQGWAIVTDIQVTDRESAWSERDGITTVSYYHIVTLDNGVSKQLGSNTIIRRFGTLDKTPFFKMAGMNPETGLTE